MGFLSIILPVSFIQFLIVGIFLLSHKKGNKISNNLLAAFLISKAFCFIGEFFLSQGGLKTDFISFLCIITSSADLLLGPSLYLYALSLIYKDYHLKPYQLLHLLPFFLYMVITTCVYWVYPGGGLAYYNSNHSIIIVLLSTTYIHFIVYSIICLITLKNFERKLKIEFSSIDKIKLSWLFFLLLGFIAIWATAYINFLGKVFIVSTLIPWEIFIVLVFIFANIIVYKGLKQPEIFSGISEDVQNIPAPKYAKTALPDDRKDELLKQILCFMKESKPYLNPSLSLVEFSEQLSIPAHLISQILNSSLNQNFFDFINSYRIEESKLTMKDKPDDTILQILFDAGFNSKSSFNRAFKKYTGMTPSEYKKTYCIT